MVSTKVASTKIVCFTLSTNDSNSVPKKKEKRMTLIISLITYKMILLHLVISIGLGQPTNPQVSTQPNLQNTS